MEKIKLILFVLGVAYIGLSLVAYFISDKLIFPIRPVSYAKHDLIIELPLENGELISTIYLPNEEAKFTIIYSHGNAEDLGHILPLLKSFHQKGFSVFAYDYPGYGLSEGKATEKSTYDAINAVYEFVTEDLKIPQHSVILYGRSLGGGPTVDLAAREIIGGVILESTFVSAFRVMTHRTLLPWDKFNNIDKINEIDCPLLVIHGTEDSIVPFWHAHALFNKAKTPKQNFWIEGAGHNNIFDFAGNKYWDRLDFFIKQVEYTNKQK